MLGTLAFGVICFAVGLITPRPAWVKAVQPVVWEWIKNLFSRK